MNIDFKAVDFPESLGAMIAVTFPLAASRSIRKSFMQDILSVFVIIPVQVASRWHLIFRLPLHAPHSVKTLKKLAIPAALLNRSTQIQPKSERQLC